MPSRAHVVHRGLSLALALAVAVAFASCGSGGGGGGSGGSGGPPVTPADGGAGSGGAGDAGGGSGAPADGGSGSTLPADGGSGSTLPADGGSGSGGGGTPDAGPGRASPCDGLMPDFAGAAREALRDLGTHTSCGPATADPAGQIALAQVGVGGSSFARIHLYQAEGAAAGDLDDDLVVTSRADIDPWFHWTSSGYQGVIVNDRNGGARFVVGTFDRGGKFVAAGTDFATAIVPDGTGGSAVLEISGLPGGEVKLSRIDDRGRYGPSATVDDPSASMLIVNWDTGHVLVLATGSSETRGRWYDRGGTALTGWFSAAGTVAPSFAALRLLVDGRAVLSDGERWVASFRDGEARSDPAPSWLADRPGTRLATVRGGRAYALLPAAGGAELEVLTAGGESCGKASVPRSTPAEGTARQPTRLDVGQDGTLLQIENATGDRLGFGVHCALRWWPALLR